MGDLGFVTAAAAPMPNGASQDCKSDVRDPTLIDEEVEDDVVDDGHDGKDDDRDDAKDIDGNDESDAGGDDGGGFDLCCAALVGLRGRGWLFWG